MILCGSMDFELVGPIRDISRLRLVAGLRACQTTQALWNGTVEKIEGNCQSQADMEEFTLPRYIGTKLMASDARNSR